MTDNAELVFYFAPMSTASITEAVLGELDIRFDGIEMDIDAGDTRDPEFLRINPNGRVPVIIHDGAVIWESAAITMYLGELFGVKAGLYPASGPERGVAMKWIVWTNTVLAEAAGRLAAALPADVDGAVQTGSVDLTDGGQGNRADQERATRDVENHFSILNDALADNSFLLGDYSLADTHLFVIAGWISMMGVDPQPFQNVVAWMARCSERPVFMKMFGD